MELNIEKIAYLQKLNANELGYRGDKPGGAGRFFLVSKSCISFFPPLSELALNDHVLLETIPPFSDEVVLSNYVYHNSKYATNVEAENRNEYRFYLNSATDPSSSYYEPGDIVVFIKILPQDNAYPVYKLFRYKITDPNYQKLLEQIEKNDARSHSKALVPLKDLTFLDGLEPISIGRKVIPPEIIEGSFNEPVEQVPVQEEDKIDTTQVIRSRSFRDLTLYFYEDRCAVTGRDLVIEYKDFKNLEAAHILARAAGGGSHPSNGMALERNLHWAFDKGFFTLTEDYKVEVHADAMHVPYLKEKHGATIFIPQDRRSAPNKDSIEWHRKNVFGLFLRTEA